MIGMLPGFDCHRRSPHSDVAAFRLPVVRLPVPHGSVGWAARGRSSTGTGLCVSSLAEFGR
jgi:hypothetical protein